MFQSRKNIRIQHRLLTRLLVSHILIVGIPLFFTGRVLIDTAQNSIEETILQRNLEFTRRSTRLIELKLNTASRIIESEVRKPSMYEMNKMPQELAIHTLVTQFDLFKQISVLDTLGNLVATTSFEGEISEYLGRNGSLSVVINKARQRERYQSDVYVSSYDHLPMLDIAEPIYALDEVVGILYAVVDLKAMWDVVAENKVGENGEAFIFNKNGLYIAHSDAKQVYSKNYFQNQQIIAKVKEGQSGHLRYRTAENEEMVAAYAPIGAFGWGAMIQQPTSEAFAPAAAMRFRVIQFMVASIVLASLIAYFYTRWIVKPVDHLVSGMDRFSKGDLNHRIEKVADDEIGTLAEHFNEMADRLIEFQNTVKRTERLDTLGKLASVLSHEIRNPLNSMVINMQILKREFSKEELNKNRIENFYNILATEIKRVDQLVTDFLLIARPPKLNKQTTAINEVMDELVMMQVADSLKKGIRVERTYESTPIEANIDASRMRQVFLNLYLNAVQSMPGGGRLKIAVQSDKRTQTSQHGITISFIDTGHGIEQEDLHKIFDFYYSTKETGTGLGLAIVQQIVEEHQGTITVESKVHEGTTFTIYLPKDS